MSVDRLCLTTSPKASATSVFLYGSFPPALESMDPDLCGVVLLENRPLMVIFPPILHNASLQSVTPKDNIESFFDIIPYFTDIPQHALL